MDKDITLPPPLRRPLAQQKAKMQFDVKALPTKQCKNGKEEERSGKKTWRKGTLGVDLILIFESHIFFSVHACILSLAASISRCTISAPPAYTKVNMRQSSRSPPFLPSLEGKEVIINAGLDPKGPRGRSLWLFLRYPRGCAGLKKGMLPQHNPLYPFPSARPLPSLIVHQSCGHRGKRRERECGTELGEDGRRR